MPAGRPKQYKDSAERQREHLLRRRLRVLENPATTNYFISVIRLMYAEIGRDVASENILPWLDADNIYEACTRGTTPFRDWFKTMSELPYIELNRLGPHPKVRIAPVTKRSNKTE
jgi:hypothetical protein